MWNWFAFFFASYVRWDRFFFGCLFANLLERVCECVGFAASHTNLFSFCREFLNPSRP